MSSQTYTLICLVVAVLGADGMLSKSDFQGTFFVFFILI